MMSFPQTKQAVASIGNPTGGTAATVGAVLTRGRYVVVPTYAGGLAEEAREKREAGIEKEYPRSTKGVHNGDYTGREERGCFPANVVAALMVMFDNLDADCDGVLCREEVRVEIGKFLLGSFGNNNNYKM